MGTVVLLDLDGTLIDSNDAHAKAWVQAFQHFEIYFDFHQIRPLIGMGSDQLIPKLTSLYPESEKAKQISELRGRIFKSKYLSNLKPFPQARALVQKFIDEKIEVVVASSASKSDLKALLKKIGIEDLICHATSSDDADKSKPAPDIILEAMKLVAAQPEDCIMLGDTPYDIQAANRAGVKTVAFTCGGCTPDQLHDAIEVYEGPWDLLREFENSYIERVNFESVTGAKGGGGGELVNSPRD